MENQGSTAAGASQQHLKAYAECQDQAALMAFFSGYQNELYAFALRVLRDSDDAQDALQMVFLDVMRRACEYRQLRSVRGWLFGMVRKAAHVIVRSRQRRQRHEAAARKERGRSMTATRFSAHELVELKDAVDSALRRLPERYRDPVMLVCCHNLSETEAAEALGEREGTIRVQLSRALAQIRTHLAAGGVALSTTALTQALGELPSPLPPATLQGRIAQVAQGKSLRPSLRRLAEESGRGKAGGWVAAGAVLLVALAGALWINRLWINRDALIERAAAAPAVPPASPEAVAPERQPVPEAPFFLRLTFDQKLPELFQLAKGSAEWQASFGPFQGVLRCRDACLIEIPQPIDERPWRVRIAYATDIARANPTWSCSIDRRGTQPLPEGGMGTWRKNLEYNLKDGRPAVVWVTFYYLGRHQFVFARDQYAHEEELTMAGAMAGPVSSDRLILKLKHVALDEVEIKQLKPEEVPLELRDPDGFIKRRGLTLTYVQSASDP